MDDDVQTEMLEHMGLEDMVDTWTFALNVNKETNLTTK